LFAAPEVLGLSVGLKAAFPWGKRLFPPGRRMGADISVTKPIIVYSVLALRHKTPR
jgi:hypothetical protein